MDNRPGRRTGPRTRAAGTLGVLAALCIIPSAAADDGTQTPAPNGTATGAALTVGNLLAISETGAEARPDGGKASAGVIVVNGQPILGTGGTQNGAGRSSGSLVDTGETPVGRVRVAPWEAEVEQSEERRSSRGRAAALDLYVIDRDTLEVEVLSSRSEAEHTNGRSSGSSSTDGARVRALDGTVDVTLLHAESSSSGEGGAYLVGVNGTKVGTSEQLGAACQLNVQQLAAIGCLSSGGGAGTGGTTTESASVADIGLTPVPALDTSLFGTQATAGAAPAAGATNTGRADRGGSGDSRTEEREETGGGEARTADDAALPNTGTGAVGLLGVSAVLLAAGGWVATAARRWRPVRIG